MKLSLTIAVQIQQMLEGVELPSSKVKHIVEHEQDHLLPAY